MKYLLLVWAILGVTFAEAQQFQFEQYTTEDGLGHNQVFDIHQDEQGFMWFGTDNGLYRFDGQEFYDMRRVDTLLEGSFTVLQTAKGGGFWAGMYKKQLFKIMPGLSGDYVIRSKEMPVGSDIVEMGDDLVSTVGQGIYHWRGDSIAMSLYRDGMYETVPELRTNVRLFSLVRNRLFPLNEDRLLHLNAYGIFEIVDGKSIVAIKSLVRKHLSCYTPASSGAHWLGGKGEIYLLKNDEVVQSIRHPNWEDANIHFLLQDSKNRLWISVMGIGVFVRFPNGEIEFKGDQLGLGSEFANYIFEDKDHAIWLATTNNGVFRAHESNLERVDFYPGEFSISALGISSKGELWVGAGKQVYQLNEEGKGTPLLPPDLQGEIQKFTTRNNRTYASVLTDQPVGRIQPTYQIQAELFAITALNSTFLDDENLLIWFGGYTSISGPVIGPLKTWQISPNGLLEGEKTFQYPDHIPWRTYNTHQSLVNPDGSIWVAQNKGLYFWRFIGDISDKPILAYDSRALLRHPDGDIVCATSEGLYRGPNKVDSSFQLWYGGISATCMLWDQEQRLWVGTQDGLYLFDLIDDKPVVKAKFVKGLAINCLLFDEGTNKLWIGTDQGLLYAYTQTLFNSLSNVPSVIITELQTEDSTYFFPQDITIPSENNYLSFSFSGLEYHDPAALQINYRLNGHPWQEIRSKEIQLAALADGNHTIEIKASNDGLKWSEPEAVEFQISPPIWKSPWIYALISILSVLIIGFLAWLRIVNVKKREREKRYMQQKVTELEQQALGAMMNPHFIFNTLNSIQHYFNQHDTADANEYLARFAQLIRLNMEVVQRPRTSLDEELDRLQIYLDLEQLRFGDKMSYQLEVEPNIDTEEIMIPSMLMQPFVENAIWHGIAPSEGKGWVQVRLEMLDEDTLRIRIDDNGPGVFSSQPDSKSSHTSRGVEITRSRLHHYSPKARLSFSERKDTDGKVLGTQVELRIPV